MQNKPTSIAKIIALSTIKKLVENSHEHLGVLIDGAIERNSSMFAKPGIAIARLATFADRAIVSTADGRYFNIKFEHINGEIKNLTSEAIEVPSVTPSNAAKSIKEFSLMAVDALMSESTDGAVKQILALADLQDQPQAKARRDYVGEALAAVVNGRPWRQALTSQWTQISRQVIDKIESIKAVALEAKYKPMYESDEIPESQFESYRKLAESDLRVLMQRLDTLSVAVAGSYNPFRLALTNDGLDEAEIDVLSHFCFFSEDLLSDLGELKSLVSDTMENEQCVMCLGQVYDTIAESLTDCEIAGVFVQRMAGALNDAA